MTKKFQLTGFAVAILSILSFLVFTNNTQAQENIQWLHEPNEQGFASIEYNGNTLSNLLDDLENNNCRVRMVWMESLKAGYLNIPSAPQFINNIFLEKYENNIPSGTTITLHCYANTPKIETKEITESSIAIEWLEDDKTKEYEIEYCLENNCETLTTVDNNITIDNLNSETEYSIRAKATGNHLNDSEYSKTELISTLPEIEDLNLEETRIQWITNPEIDTDRNKQGTAIIQYGGGSFYQLISRLSIEGCEVINLQIDGTTYDFRNTNEQNQDFTDLYNEQIAQNTNITIMCVDNCEVVYGYNQFTDEAKADIDENLIICEELTYDPEFVKSYTECETDWNQYIQKAFLQIPVLQDVCKVIIVQDIQSGYSLYLPNIVLGVIEDVNVAYQDIKTVILIANDQEDIDTEDIYWTYGMMHEICRINQNWHALKQNVNLDYFASEGQKPQFAIDLWYDTDMAREFIELTKFEQKTDGTWKLKGRIKGISDYASGAPSNLAADACALYMLKNIQGKDLDRSFTKYIKKPYLTEELEEWVEKYIVLPA